MDVGKTGLERKGCQRKMVGGERGRRGENGEGLNLR